MTNHYPIKILVAEDHAINQRIILFLLKKAGYDADIVDNGRKAIEAVQRRKYDIIFMDIQMPEIDGIEATRIIHQVLPIEQHPIIIAVTANEMSDDRKACLKVGMSDYINKPIQANIIYSVIEKWRRELNNSNNLGLI